MFHVRLIHTPSGRSRYCSKLYRFRDWCSENGNERHIYDPFHEPFDELKNGTHIDGKLCFRGQVGPEERYLDVSGPVTMFSDVSVYGHQFFPAVKISIMSNKKDFLKTREIMGRL